jgi:hypothetical protein
MRGQLIKTLTSSGIEPVDFWIMQPLASNYVQDELQIGSKLKYIFHMQYFVKH